MTFSIITNFSELRPKANVQLFCLPHAGGSISYYLPWNKLIPDFIELQLLQLPGRGASFKEPLLTDWPTTISSVSSAIEKLIDRPFAIFGHSLGALIAFEVAQKIQNKNLVHLFVSGMSAPQHYKIPQLRYTLSDSELLNYISNTDDATPNKDDNYFQYLQFMLPTIRADFQLVDTYQYHHTNLLQCSLSAMCGKKDSLYSTDDVAYWSEIAGKEFNFKVFDDGHMYLTSERDEVIKYLVDSLWKV